MLQVLPAVLVRVELVHLRLLDRDAVDSYQANIQTATQGFTQKAYFNSGTMSSGPWRG